MDEIKLKRGGRGVTFKNAPDHFDVCLKRWRSPTSQRSQLIRMKE